MKTLWDKEKNTLTIIIDLRREKIRPRRPAQFSFSVQIDDDACKFPCNVKNWGKFCGVNRVFTCPTISGENTKKWKITKADRAFPCSNIALKLQSTGTIQDKCYADVNACECFNNLAEVQQAVCKYCGEES